MLKTCFKCGRVLPMSEYYAHPRMADGHLNKCKECARLDIMQNRRKRADYYRDYDRARSRHPDRASWKKESNRRQRQEEPEKCRARRAAATALRNGHLCKEPCYFCGATTGIEMHHPDYSQPLRVYWLCRLCHSKLHGMAKLGVRSASDFLSPHTSMEGVLS